MRPIESYGIRRFSIGSYVTFKLTGSVEARASHAVYIDIALQQTPLESGTIKSESPMSIPQNPLRYGTPCCPDWLIQ